MEVIQVPMNVQPNLDMIFGAVLVGGIDRRIDSNLNLLSTKISISKMAYNMFKSRFQYNIFNEAYAIFWEILCTRKVSSLDKGQLELILDNNRNKLLNSEYIDTTKYSISSSGNVASDDDKIMAIKADIIDEFVRLSYIPVDIDQFKSACIIYSDWYKEAFMENTCQNMAIMMQDNGYDVKLPGKRPAHLQGSADVQKYWNERIRIMKSLEEVNDNRVVVRDENWLIDRHNDKNNEDNEELCLMGIQNIDTVMGPLRRGRMYGILGAPKGGKTRFANFLVETLILNGFNVAVWAVEGSSSEWLAMQTSCAIAMLSKKAITSGQGSEIIRISDEDILSKKYLKASRGIRGNNSLASIVWSTESALAKNERYGRLSFIEEPAYAETFIDVLKNHYDNVNPFDAIVIDPLINIGSLKGIQKVQRVTDAYTDLHRFIQKELPVPAAAIIPAQLKQSVIDELRKHPENTMDVTAGGESAETIRTPDEIIGLFSTKEERDSNMMNIYSVASRHNGTFDDFVAKCYLDCCMFMSPEDGGAGNV